MLDEVSDKFGQLKLFGAVWARPLAFPETEDVANKDTRKRYWKFFFFAIAVAIAVVAVVSSVISARHLESICPEFGQLTALSGKRLNAYVVAFLFIGGTIVHAVYLVSFKANGRSFRQYLSLFAVFTGFFVLNNTAILIPNAVALDRLLDRNPADIFRRCGATATVAEDFTFSFSGGQLIRIQPNTRIDDPLQPIRDTPEWSFMLLAGFATIALTYIAPLLLVVWTAKFYQSSIKMALVALVVASLPIAIITEFEREISWIVSDKLDKALPTQVRVAVKHAIGF